jgi:hypothetical protein
VGVHQVHVPGPACVQPGLAAHHLDHERGQVDPAGHQWTGAAMVGRHRVLLVQVGQHTGVDALLPDTAVELPRHPTLRPRLGQHALDQPDPHYQAQRLHRIEGHRRAHPHTLDPPARAVKAWASPSLGNGQRLPVHDTWP